MKATARRKPGRCSPSIRTSARRSDRSAGDRRGRGAGARAADHAGLPQPAPGDGPSPEGRLAAHRRHGRDRRGGLSLHPRSQEGHGDRRRLQRLSARGGGGADQPPRGGEAAVVGGPDPYRGECLHAYVSLRQDISREALLEYCKERLAPYKIPSTLEVLDALPKTSVNKLDKLSLKARWKP